MAGDESRIYIEVVHGGGSQSICLKRVEIDSGLMRCNFVLGRLRFSSILLGRIVLSFAIFHDIGLVGDMQNSHTWECVLQLVAAL